MKPLIAWMLAALSIVVMGCRRELPLVYPTLKAAVENGDLADVRQHLQRGADVQGTRIAGEPTPLFMAASLGHLDIVKLLVSRGAEINATETDAVYGGATPLHGAAGQGHLEVVRFLVSRKADVNATFKGGLTPLMLAAAQGHGEVERFLKQHREKR